MPRSTPQEMEVSFSNTVVPGTNLVQWLIGESPLHLNYSSPSIENTLDRYKTFERHENVYDVGAVNTWQCWVMQQDPANAAAVPHPIYLHGHDFYILEPKAGATWTGDVSILKRDNPTRRDTATLPYKGCLVLAFESENPGVWLMHCHTPFHLSQGFGVQFAERREDIKHSVDAYGMVEQGWRRWETWRKKAYPDGFSSGDITL